ncbi:hypothetical protein PIB30_067608 [Stylosanthes scabra]|uniref:Putative plant transposon protein domain-containing protein n=1 Tax=Stylosanthes scabra TaxID=79078 RepID=A0ABU6ZLB8_9FABA|nr:hypothetical protein [Stylosanthes scabra]
MASSSSTVSIFNAHCFRKAHNEQLFDSYARRRKVILEVGFNLEEDEYPEIMEQIALRGWRRLAAPRTDISKLLVQEFYANAAPSDEEAAVQEELPYKSFVRGKEIDFSPNNIRRVMRFKRETAVGNYNIKGHSNPHHHARGRCESGGNHSRQYGNNSSRIGKQGEPCTSKHYLQIVQGCRCSLEGICKNSKDSVIELHYGKEDGTIRFPRHQQPQQQEDEEEDEPMPQADGGNFEEEDQQPPQQNQPPQQDQQP